MQRPAFDVEVIVALQGDRSIFVDGRAVTLKTLTQIIDDSTVGQRAKVDVLISPPQDESPEFIGFVKKVQTEVRRAKDQVIIGYRTMT